MNRQGLGRAGEARAWRYLKGKGLRLITKNWRCKLGELDLIARQGDTLVIVEVRTTASRRPFKGTPECTVGAEKQRRIKRLARLWLTQSSWQPQDIRFDVVSLRKRSWLRWDIEHFPNAFEDA